MNDIQVLRGPPDPSDPALTHLSAIVHLGPAHVRPPHSTSQVHLLILSKVIRNAQDSQSYIHHRATLVTSLTTICPLTTEATHATHPNPIIQ